MYLHHAYACEPGLLANLGERITTTLHTRDDAPLRAFWTEHAEVRVRRFDAHRVPLDVRALAKARERLGGLENGPHAGDDSVRELLRIVKNVPNEERLVSSRAFRMLTACAERIAGFAPEMPFVFVEAQVADARRAVESLEDGGLAERELREGAWDPREIPEASLAFECLRLVRAAGWDDEYGLLEEYDTLRTFDEHADLFVPGGALYGVPLRGESMHASAATWAEFHAVCGPLESFQRPAWSQGADLAEAVTRLDEARARVAHAAEEDLERFDERSSLFRAALQAGVTSGHAVVEWVEKE